MKYLLFYLCFLFAFSLSAQKEKTITIDPNKESDFLLLSQIAEEVIPIPLSKSVGPIQSVHLTDDFLYTCGIRSIAQFDLSGNLLKNVDCKDFLSSITGDHIKKYIYVSNSNNEIKCYDYSLQEKRTYETKYNIGSIFFYNGKLWIQSYNYQNEIADYKISELNVDTGEETFMPFDYKVYPDPTGIGFFSARFTVYDDKPIFAFFRDSILYKIENDHIVPFVRLQIKSTKELIHKKTSIVSSKGFIGKYLFINYEMQSLEGNSHINSSYLYLKNEKDGDTYNLKSDKPIHDDVYHTGYCKISSVLNNQEMFYYIIDKKDIVDSRGTITIGEGPIILIIKIKR